jgi:RNA polymerase sigma-70 factor (ECF subfamily)
MAESLPLHPELLVRHAPGLRRLARQLLHDGHAADDAVQDTWLRALQHPPATGERLGAWLRSVLRSRAHLWRRTAARRARRERAVARPVAVDPALDTVLRAQAVQSLAAAVLALPEVYREYVWLRWFDGCKPGEIARRLGVPVATVHARHKRALARLRQELRPDRDARLGAGLLALARAPSPWAGLGAPLAPAPEKLAFVAMLAASAIACVALLLVAPPTPPGIALAALARPDTASATASAPAFVPRAREPIAAPAPPFADGYPFELEVTAHTMFDLASPALGIYLAPSDQPLNFVGRTGDDGRLVVRWRAPRPAMEVALAPESAYGTPARLLRLVVRSGTATTVTLRDDEALPCPEGERERAAPPPTSCAQCHEPERSFPPPLRATRDALGWSAFTMGPVPATHPESTLRPGTPPDVGAACVTVRGTVRDENGQPLAGAPVFGALAADLAPAWRATADSYGAFALELPPVRVFLRAGGGAFGVACETRDLGAQRNEPWSPVLARGLELRGRVRGADPGWTVVATAQGGGAPHVDADTLDEEGCFSIPNVPALPFRIEVFARECVAVAVHVESGVWPSAWPGGTAIDIEVPEHLRELATITARLRHPDGSPARFAGLRLWRVDAPRGTEELTATDDALRLALPGGTYRVFTGDTEGPWHLETIVTLRAGASFDLGELQVRRMWPNAGADR